MCIACKMEHLILSTLLKVCSLPYFVRHTEQAELSNWVYDIPSQQQEYMSLHHLHIISKTPFMSLDPSTHKEQIRSKGIIVQIHWNTFVEWLWKITLKDDYSQTVSYCCATALGWQVFTPSFAFSPYSILQPCGRRNLIHTIQIKDWEWSSWAGSQARHSLEVSLQPSIKLLMPQCLHLSHGTLDSSYLVRTDEMS